MHGTFHSHTCSRRGLQEEQTLLLGGPKLLACAGGGGHTNTTSKPATSSSHPAERAHAEQTWQGRRAAAGLAHTPAYAQRTQRVAEQACGRAQSGSRVACCCSRAAAEPACSPACAPRPPAAAAAAAQAQYMYRLFEAAHAMTLASGCHARCSSFEL